MLRQSFLSWICTASFLSWEFRCARGMQVTSTGPQSVQRAEGEGVTLGCTYTSSPWDTGELDIEWSVLSPDTTQKDQMLLSYTSGTEYNHGHHGAASGLRFASPDPSTGDASLSIAALSTAHSATYQCKVKKSPGVDTRKLSLLVMARPSVPQCWVAGEELVGRAVALHCQSAQGSTPLTYSWRREHARTVPAAASQNGGELTITNHSLSSAGIYVCEVNNAVGAERCRIRLQANKPPNGAAVMVGTLVGSLLLVIILLVFVGLLYWKMSDRFGREKEFSNEIREDVPPPESRPSSRRASQHPRVTYHQMGVTTVTDSDGAANSQPSNSCAPVKHTPLEYDSTYGYAV